MLRIHPHGPSGEPLFSNESRASQVWYLLIEYLGYIQQKGFNLVKVLSFILQLGFCSLGTDYVCDNDDTEMSQVIQHFRELGLVFKRKGSSKENVIQMSYKFHDKIFLTNQHIARFYQKSIF